MAYLAQGVINPAAVATLLDQPGGFHQLEVAADVGLRFAEGVAKLADTKAAGGQEQAAGRAKTKAFAEGGKEVAALRCCHFHIFQYMNM